MARVIAFVLVLTFLAGCSTFSRHHRGAAVGADIAAVGGAVLIFGNRSCDDDWGEEYACQSEITGYLVGHVVLGVALVAGAILLGDEAVHRASARGDDDAVPRAVAASPDERTIQFAKQARRAAERGDCEAARRMLTLIADRDPDYHASMALGPAVAACR